MAAPIPALLLCAGLGTRLRPLTRVRSKPAIPVAGEPMVRRIARWLAAADVRDIVLNLHHLPHTIAAMVGDGSDIGVRARYSWEQPVVLGSAGGPRQALDILGAPTFFIVNGDTLTDLALAPLRDAHERSDALVTMALVPNAQPQRYGGVRLSPDGAVTGFVRKGSAEPSCHFIGVQVASRDAFADVPAGQVTHSVGDVYDRLIARQPGSIRGYLCDAGFWDVGTLADYWATHRAFAGSPGAPQPATEPTGRAAQVVESIVWDRVQFGAGCRLTRCIVTDDVCVAPGAVYEDVVLLRGADGQTEAVPFSRER